MLCFRLLFLYCIGLLAVAVDEIIVFIFCRTSLSLRQKAAFLMPPKVQVYNSSGIAEASDFM